MLPMTYQTLTEPVIARAGQDPDHLTLVYLGEDGSVARINAGEFHRRALNFACALQNIDIGEEDLVILVLPHSQALLSAFWGALYRGAIPSIFPFLTEKLDPDIYRERVRALVAHSGAKAVITYPAFKEDLSALLAEVDCRALSIDEIEKANLPQVQTPEDEASLWKTPDGEKIAFLQHSSGTTGLQKGVALSHRAVLSQIREYGQTLQLAPEDVIVSWLPLYHDMGLIAGFVMPIAAGIPLVLMSPFQWVRDPKILLSAIQEYKGTLCWLPNFAYNHSVRKIRARKLEGLDLSSLRAVINCSEPVRDDSHQMFVERFAPYGFRESALGTSYAMAENVFAVTQSEMGKPPRVDWVELRTLQEARQAVPASPDDPDATPMVSNGPPIGGVEIAVVDESGERLPERRVGEIILRGSSMLSGYYRRPDLTAEAIKDGWYYTGDMGYLAEGELYVSGRKKDLIIVGGKNVYPQDLEAIANEVEGIHPGRAVAFGLMDEAMGSEKIIMVCELLDPVDEEATRLIERALRTSIVQQTEVTLAGVRLVEGAWVLKTSSGKIARSANRDKYLQVFH